MLSQLTPLLALAGLVPAVSALATDNDLAILAGTHVIYSFPDEASPPEELLNLTRAGLVGGVILFGENINSSITPSAMAALQDAYSSSPAPAVIEAHTGVSHAPLLIMTDQEGGLVKRITDGGPDKSAKEVGESEDPAAAGALAGSQAAETLLRYNNNANLAPVLGVYHAEGDFLDGKTRSFGSTPELVSEAGVAFLRAMEEGGVAASAKHFPGLGRAPAGANTDLEPVTINATREELAAVDLPPFQDAVDAGVDMVMTSWAIYPSVDDVWPAGLSKAWVRQRLRRGMGFKGVTVTDAIEAGSLEPFGDAAELAVLASTAGMDLLLASGRDVAQGVEVREGLVGGVTAGTVDRADFDAATKRIVALRKKLGSGN